MCSHLLQAHEASQESSVARASRQTQSPDARQNSRMSWCIKALVYSALWMNLAKKHCREGASLMHMVRGAMRRTRAP